MAIKQMKQALADRRLKEIINMREKAELDELSRIANARYEGKIEGLKEGELKGKIEGLKEGELKGKIEAAQKLLTTGMNKNEIAKLLNINENLF